MPEIWVGALAMALACAAVGLASWAALRAHDITELHDRLVQALRDGEGHSTTRKPSVIMTSTDIRDTPPPALPDGTLVWDWLRSNIHNPAATLDALVDASYDQFCADQLVGPYLRDIDRPVLQHKFTAMVIMLLKQGVTRQYALAMTRKHAHVCAPDGTPITGAVFDHAIDLFGWELAAADIPAAAITAIVATINPPAPLPSLREAIVVEV